MRNRSVRKNFAPDDNIHKMDEKEGQDSYGFSKKNEII
jgi:hypothetical protein